MESVFSIKATGKEICNSLENEQVFTIRYYELISSGLYKVCIRHHERRSCFRGTYTLKKVREILAKERYEYIPCLPEGFEDEIFDRDEWFDDIEKNEKRIKKIEEDAKNEKLLLYRFIYIPVFDGVAIYQIIKISKRSCSVRYCSRDGFFDYLISGWGKQTTLPIDYIQSQIHRQDCLDLLKGEGRTNEE